MENEILIITIKVNMLQVYTHTKRLLPKESVSLFEIPPGLIPGDYQHLQLELTRKGGDQ